MKRESHDVVVLGGGISGLTVARDLHRAGVDVCLLEAGRSVGGCIRTERRDGFLLEKGPFNVIVRDPAFEDLLAELSNEITIVCASSRARKRYIYRGGRLLRVPTNPLSLLTTPLLGFGARLRVLRGLFASRAGTDQEETIEQVAVRRFGTQFSDTFVSAMIAGIFAGDIRRLSLQACFPKVAQVDRQAGSLIGYGLKSVLGPKRGGRKKGRRRWRGLVSIDGGLGALTEAMGRELGEARIAGARAECVRRVEDDYEVDYRAGDNDPMTTSCRCLVLAVPAGEAARLLEPLLPRAAESLATVRTSSLTVLNLGYRAADVAHPLNGFGFLVPHDEPDFPLMGVLWSDTIFPHHAPNGHRLIRVFIGGARDPGAASRPEAELISTAKSAIRDLLGITGEPVLTDLCRHPNAIPQYEIGHTQRIEKLESIIATSPNLYLAGNYLRGVSLNDCVREGRNTASRIIEESADGGVEPSQKNRAVPACAAG